jgi:spore coat protein CotH
MRQCLSYALIREMGYPAPRCNYARVCVGNVDMGVYVNVEPLGPGFTAHFFGDKAGKGLLIEGDSGGNNTGKASDLYKSGAADTFNVKVGNADDLDTNFSSPLYKKVSRLLDSDSKNYSDDDIDTLGKFVDLGLLRQFFLVEHVVAHFDGAMGNRNNYGMYLRPDSGKWQFIPWGMDETFRELPTEPYEVHKLAKAIVGSKRLRKGLADDYAALVAKLSASEWKGRVAAQATVLKLLLSAAEQAAFDQDVAMLTAKLGQSLTRNPANLFR